MNRTHTRLATLLGSCCVLLIAAHAFAEEERTWRWPLYKREIDPDTNRVVRGEPRPAVWTSNGEYSGRPFADPAYAHPGIDIRGDLHDIVIAPQAGEIQRIFNYDDCVNAGDACRIWFETVDYKYLYYLSHISIDDEVTRDAIRDAITEVSQGSTYPNQSFIVNRSDLLGVIQFADWPHVHLGVVDRESNYDRINPLALMKQEAQGTIGPAITITDDEPPVVEEIILHYNEDTASAELSSTECGDIVQGVVDVDAYIHDTFYTDSTLTPFEGDGYPTTGIRRAWYSIYDMEAHQVVQEALWYDMQSIPYRKGFTYMVTEFNNEFYEKMPDDPPGAPLALEDITDTLFVRELSSSHYTSVEGYLHRMTNADGEDGCWDTAASGLGRYSVTVAAEDFAGLKSSRSEFYFVTQDNQPVDVSEVSDAYVRDHAQDNGAVPSNAGGQPFWASRDIIIVPRGQAVDIDSQTTTAPLMVGGEYDVYVRIHNNGCAAAENVKVKIFSTDPQIITVPGEWDYVTEPAGVFVGDAANPDGVEVPGMQSPDNRALLGPFPWAPEQSDLPENGGHPCMLAVLDAPGDTVPEDQQWDAANQNNVAQANLQFSQYECALANPYDAPLEVVLTLTATVSDENLLTYADVRFPYVEPFTAWLEGVVGANVWHEGDWLVVSMSEMVVTLPAITLDVGEAFQILGDFSSAFEGTIDVSVNIDNQAVGGCQFIRPAGPIVVVT